MAGLLGQVLKIAFIIIAILIALQVVGVNLTALTILSGTLGIGIGFGLQAIFSNFVSGLIILIEKSVKVGDFIELQSGVTGLVREINIRSTLVTTNDNVDILVPNEEFIKAQVINWTLREARRRTHVPFGVAYGSDKELVRKAGFEAADEVEWTLKGMPGRSPQVWLTKFGDSALEFELVVWFTDAAVAVRHASSQIIIGRCIRRLRSTNSKSPSRSATCISKAQRASMSPSRPAKRSLIRRTD
jgi:potassium efflux system protein